MTERVLKRMDGDLNSIFMFIYIWSDFAPTKLISFFHKIALKYLLTFDLSECGGFRAPKTTDQRQHVIFLTAKWYPLESLCKDCQAMTSAICHNYTSSWKLHLSYSRLTFCSSHLRAITHPPSPVPLNPHAHTRF